MGTITFEGSGPYTLPEATGASVQRSGSQVMISVRLWKSPNTWTLVRVPLPQAVAQTLSERLAEALEQTNPVA